MKKFLIQFDRLQDFDTTILADSKESAEDIFFTIASQLLGKKPNNEHITIYEIEEITDEKN